MQTSSPSVEASEATLTYRGETQNETQDIFVADMTPKLGTWKLLKLAWSDRGARSDHLWDLFALWWSSANDLRIFFSEIDEEEGGRLLWKKKLYQWWSDNWWIVLLVPLAFLVTVVFAWWQFAPGKDVYGSKHVHLLPPENVFDWSVVPEQAKMYARVSCIPFKEDELARLKMNEGPWFANLEKAVTEIMDKEQFAALAAIHLGKDYDRCFAGVWDEEKKVNVFMINPKLINQSSGKQESLETSSFCDGQEISVMRPKVVQIEYVKANGRKELSTFKGSSAAMAFHAIEQLDGKCICNSLE